METVSVGDNFIWLVLRYLLFVIEEGQVAKDLTSEILPWRLSPAGPSAVIKLKKKNRSPPPPPLYLSNGHENGGSPALGV
jgi:hypothetical protein